MTADRRVRGSTPGKSIDRSVREEAAALRPLDARPSFGQMREPVEFAALHTPRSRTCTAGERVLRRRFRRSLPLCASTVRPLASSSPEGQRPARQTGIVQHPSVSVLAADGVPQRTPSVQFHALANRCHSTKTHQNEVFEIPRCRHLRTLDQ